MLEPSCAQLVVALLVLAARAVLYFFARRLMASNNVLEVRWLGDDRRSEAFGCRERALHVLDVYSTHGSSS
jgi:hypothetical protein